MQAPAARRRADAPGGRRRVDPLEGVIESAQLEPLTRALLDDRLEPVHALIPPVAEQLGIDRADDQPAARASQARDRALDEVRRVLARRARAHAHGRTRRRHWPTGCGDGRCDGGSRGRRPRPDSRPDSRRARSCCGRSGRAAVRRRRRAGAGARPRRDRGCSSARRTPRAHLRRSACPRATARTRTPAATARRASRRRSARRCERMPLCSCRCTPTSLANSGRIGVRRSGRPLGVSGESAEQIATAFAQVLERREVVAVGALELACERLLAGPAQPGGVALVALAAHLLDETSRSARRRRRASSWSHSTGVSDSVNGAPPSSRSSSGR